MAGGVRAGALAPGMPGLVSDLPGIVSDLDGRSARDHVTPRGGLHLLLVSITMEVTGRYGSATAQSHTWRIGPWATTRATCATWSSTSSRCSAARTCWATGPTRTSTPTPPARCSRRSRASPRTSWQPRSPEADRNPPVYDPQTHSVTMPESFKKSFQAYVDSGFWSVDVPGELDGTVAPPSLKWAMNEMVLGANPAVAMFAASYSFGKLLYILGNDEQKKLARWIVEKGWHCTMVLTEPDAGSDVGAGRTKAVAERGRHLEHHRRQALHHLAPSPTWSTTSCTSCSPAPRAPARAPRACRCSSCRSSTSTSRPVSSASATASTSPTSSTRWA